MQVKLARLRTLRKCHEGRVQRPNNGVLCLGEQGQLLDLSEMSSSRLCKFVGCLVDALLVLTDQHGSEATEEPNPFVRPHLIWTGESYRL